MRIGVQCSNILHQCWCLHIVVLMAIFKVNLLVGILHLLISKENLWGYNWHQMFTGRMPFSHQTDSVKASKEIPHAILTYGIAYFICISCDYRASHYRTVSSTSKLISYKFSGESCFLESDCPRKICKPSVLR